MPSSEGQAAAQIIPPSHLLRNTLLFYLLSRFDTVEQSDKELNIIPANNLETDEDLRKLEATGAIQDRYSD